MSPVISRIEMYFRHSLKLKFAQDMSCVLPHVSSETVRMSAITSSELLLLEVE